MQGKVVVPKLRDPEGLRSQGFSSLLATKLSALAPGLEWASSRNQSHPLKKLIKGRGVLGLPFSAATEVQPRGKGALNRPLRS